MPSLDFKGKSFIYTHHLGVPYRELLVVPKKSCVPEGKTPDLDDNLILHGDNLEALKALLPRYAGRVDCIYIDPPYNTGTEGWCYNDAVNAPLMREWLKKEGNPVERDDLQRHDKWLCMMWPRLQLLKDLLAEDGAIFVSIDDNEAHRLRAVMDEIFGEENFACCIPWQSRESVQNDTDISANHEFIVVYAKSRRQTERRLKESNAAKWYSMPGFTFFPLPLSKEKFANPDGDKRGLWKDDPFDAPGVRKNLEYQITNPKTGEIFLPPKGRHWRTEEENYHRLFQDDRIVFGKTGDSGPKLKVFYEEKCKFGEVATTWFPGSSYGTATSGTKELMEILGQGAFDYPKPTRLVVELLRLATDKDSLILDSFAGSGTTAHAVLALNAKDGGKRRFILCETEAYADTLTAERVRRVIRGYDYTGTQETELHPPEKLTWTTFAKDKNRNEILECIEGIESLERGNYDKIEKKITDGVLTITGQKQVKEKMPGLGGSFTYLELGEAMDLERLLAETPGTLPSFPALARYLFFTATGHTLPATDTPAAPKPGAKVKGKAKAKPAPETAPTDAPVLIGETTVWRIYLHYRPDEAWLRSPAAAFTRTQAEAIAAESKDTGKQALVFAAAKFINHRSLRELTVDFAQLPYALHRVQAE